FHSGWRKSDARPEFQRLMADATEDKFDVVLVFHTSRFARSQLEARRYKQLLRDRLGIRVVSVTQPMGEDPNDPSTFLAESIHEMFDEYYSVSLSFWVRSGLREKARQGRLLGTLPWGYLRDPATGLAVPDAQEARLVLELFRRYAIGDESDRSLAAWLNAQGARTRRGRDFSSDTVREMLRNAAYAGYVTAAEAKTERSADSTIRSFPRTCSPGYRRSAPIAPASASPADPQTSTCCASSCTARGAADACKEPEARGRRYGATNAPLADTAASATSRSPRQSRSKAS
ncbi:MAG TPA: recombinase family protein, partial [Solirubrobacteraceae bacterium]|nr:recombinase family protein [Solirubrobacteraceae bacterium]